MEMTEAIRQVKVKTDELLSAMDQPVSEGETWPSREQGHKHHNLFFAHRRAINMLREVHVGRRIAPSRDDWREIMEASRAALVCWMERDEMVLYDSVEAASDAPRVSEMFAEPFPADLESVAGQE